MKSLLASKNILDYLLSKEIPIELPSKEGKTNQFVSLKNISSEKDELILDVVMNITFKTRHLTKNILRFYAEKQLQQFFKLFSTEEKIKCNFIFQDIYK